MWFEPELSAAEWIALADLAENANPQDASSWRPTGTSFEVRWSGSANGS